MGASAFMMLMLAELGLSVVAFSRSASEHFATYGTLGGQIGPAGQVAFGLFPGVYRGSSALDRRAASSPSVPGT